MRGERKSSTWDGCPLCKGGHKGSKSQRKEIENRIEKQIDRKMREGVLWIEGRDFSFFWRGGARDE
jgi:hypothetical protein